jgi:hypothetical protein
LIVGGGSAGHPPAGLCCFAGQGSDEGTSLMMPRHRLKNIINKLVNGGSNLMKKILLLNNVAREC